MDELSVPRSRVRYLSNPADVDPRVVLGHVVVELLKAPHCLERCPKSLD